MPDDCKTSVGLPPFKGMLRGMLKGDLLELCCWSPRPVRMVVHLGKMQLAQWAVPVLDLLTVSCVRLRSRRGDMYWGGIIYKDQLILPGAFGPVESRHIGLAESTEGSRTTKGSIMC